MSSLRRPSRPKKGGLVFSSTAQKKRRSASPISVPTKRIHISSEPDVTASLPTSTSTTKPKIATRILIISDTHGVSALPNPISQSQDQKIDIVLHCGDLSECGTLEEYKNTIELLESIPAPLRLVIPGNHDLTLDRNFWKSNCTEEGKNLHDEAQAIWTNDTAKEAGIELLDEGSHEFVLENGAKFRIYASPFTRNSEGVREWAFGYESAEDRFNPKGESISYGRPAGTERSVLQVDNEVDVVMTHGPTKYRLDLSANSDSLGCPHLFRAIRRTRPKLHVFGHVHKAYGAEIVRWNEGKEMPEDDDVDDGTKEHRRIEGFVKDGLRNIGAVRGEKGTETLFLNAALMGRDGKLDNAPWLVDIELEPA
ncbi:uncharacterized protein PAC_13706 [Phialocephala subalpina]|uniref:Calcineurin-like phosphoesterase domain-containing protein n=1 Tax=Phialocephala subalpina TaxID=576137 RepID=A0A1L7XFI7_9HELO|nr:uncharacterized protein PAC_13706 [Phialocephala subalpina]